MVQRFGNCCHQGEVSLLVSPIRTASGGTSEGLNGDPVISNCSAIQSARVLIGSLLYSGWTQALSKLLVIHFLGFSQPPFIGSEDDRKHSALETALLLMLGLSNVLVKQSLEEPNIGC
uniref:ANTR2 n=1 Tax=Arundo donax TaxID=35708 RepID=A0A0A9G186_ARUDO